MGGKDKPALKIKHIWKEGEFRKENLLKALELMLENWLKEEDLQLSKAVK